MNSIKPHRFEEIQLEQQILYDSLTLTWILVDPFGVTQSADTEF